MTSKKRVIFLDCARALCMIWIVGFWHMQEYTNLSLTGIFFSNITNGVLATFTLISGYFLGQKNISSIQDTVTFYKKRLLRFYPLFFVSCTSFLAIYLIWGIKYISSVSQYFLTLFGLSCFIPPTPQTIWYVSMLILLYAITPFILSRNSTNKKLISMIIIYAVLIVLKSKFLEIDTRVLVFVPFYFAGLAMAQTIKFSDTQKTWKLMISMIVFLLLSIPNMFCFSIWMKIVASAFFVVLIFEIGKICAKFGLVEKTLTFVSYGSMCAYLFHRQYFGLIYKVIGTYSIWIAYILVVPSLIIGAYFVQKVYDRIVLKIIKL